MDIERYLREVVVEGHGDKQEHIPSDLHVHKVSRNCQSYCSARISRDEVDIVANTCACVWPKEELKRHVDGGQTLQPRQVVQPEEPLSERSRYLAATSLLAPSADAAAEPTNMSASEENGIMSPETTLATPDPTASSAASTDGFSAADSTDGTFLSSKTMTGTPLPTATDDLSSSFSTDSSTISSNAGGGLSESSKIGLGVGLGVGLLLLFAAIAFFCLARRRRKRAMEMGAKHTPHARSDLSMIEQSHPEQMKAEHAYASQPAERQPLQSDWNEHSEALPSQVYHENPAPPVSVLQPLETQNPVTPIEADSRGSDYSPAPLALTITGDKRQSGISRGQSPVRSHSPVSPVSPLSALSPATSRTPSPKARQ